ncbi:DUF2235 domain-containing protein [Pseudomonas putida]
MPSKNIVLFSDGTGNSSGKLFKTNVWRVYQALDLTDPQVLEVPRQFAYYDDGVGTSTFKPLALAGGAFGVGLARNVIDLYVFLCRTYQPGDRIYAFGFSRGAFTIRVLVALVMKQGLLRYDGSEEDLQRWARDAYRAYRGKNFPGNVLVRASRWARDRILRCKNHLTGRVCFEEAERIGTPDGGDPVKVEFLGLWDTVDAYGLPVDQLTRAIDRFIFPLTMRNYVLSDRVNCARHALSLDDERRSFYPRLWTEEGENSSAAQRVSEQRICQVWFAGVHSNVGGGYPDDSLSYVPLQWIMNEANRCGLRFKEAIWDELRALSDETGPLYDSRKGIASYYAYNPRRMETVNHSAGVCVARAKVHESVLRRIRDDPQGYAPSVLSEDFDVVRINGEILDVNDYLDMLAESDPHSTRLINPHWLGSYGAAREQVFNTIWWRRIAYYLTLTVSLTLFSMPAWAPGAGGCHASLCFLAAPIKLLDYVLPSFASAWTHSFASNPQAFLPLLAALGLCFWFGRKLDVRISDRMRRIWYAIAPLKPKAVYGIKPPPALNGFSRSIEQMRRSRSLSKVARCLTRRVLPFAFVLAIIGYTAVLGTQLVFNARSSFGSLCTPSPTAGSTFATAQLCHDAGMAVTAGTTYRVTFEIPHHWQDASIPASPAGFTCKLRWYKALAFAAFVPARRHPSEGWFQPMVKIGEKGNDVYALQGASVDPSQLNDCPEEQDSPPPPPCPAMQAWPSETTKFELRFVARSSGPLYLYVNDAVGVPFMGDFFYANNHGCAKVQVTPIVAEPL